MYLNLDLSRGWSLLDLPLDEGLRPRGRPRPFEARFRPEEALAVSLPVTAQAALVQAGRLPDPYHGRQDEQARWVEEREWWYLREFDLPRRDGTWCLTFEGATYRAEAWLNGIFLGAWTGTFLTRAFDLPPDLLRDRENRLAVRVRAQERAWTDGGEPGPRGYPNSTAQIRTQGPVPQFAYGWNWAPHLVAVGLWRPVRLEWFEAGRLSPPRVEARLDRGLRRGRLLYRGSVENLGSEEREFRVAARLGDPSGAPVAESSVTLRVPAGRARPLRLDLAVADPALWWPNGYGGQPLYALEVALEEGGRAGPVWRSRHGFRRMRFVRNSRDREVQARNGETNRPWSVVGDPHPWTLEVNGRRIFAQGTNWCPSDSLLRVDADRVDRPLDLIRRARTVVLRVWGGGLTESERFYDHCDELGLVCFQEFWMACGSAPAMDREAFLANARSEVRRLRHRTCLALWCGGNEFNPDAPENRPLIDALARAVAEEDPSREFRRGSPYRGDRHGGLVSLPRRVTNKYSDLLPGDSRITLFRSECAVGRSPPRPESVGRFLPPEALWPIDWALFQHHHAQRAEWEQVAGLFGPGRDWEEESLRASVWHCVDNRMNLEFNRARKYQSSGCLTWHANGCWPSFHREHIDWYGFAKPVYFWYREASAPLWVMADTEGFVWHPGERFQPRLHAISDLDHPVDLRVRVRLLDLSGQVRQEWREAVRLAPDSARPCGRPSWPVPSDLAGSVFLLLLEWWTADPAAPADPPAGPPLGSNAYYHAVAPDECPGPFLTPGPDLALHHGGTVQTVRVPHYFTRREIVDEPVEDIREQRLYRTDDFCASYRTSFTLPPDWRDHEWELCLPGISADDRTSVNGHLVGETLLDPATEPNYLSDPLRWPRLPWRFHDLPAAILRDGPNDLVLDLDGTRLADRTDKRFGLTEALWVRPRTAPAARARLRDYYRAARFFEPLTRSPADLLLEVAAEAPDRWRVRVANRGPGPAPFLVLDVEGDAPDNRFHFERGAYDLLPAGEDRVTTVEFDRPPAPGAVAVLRSLCDRPLRRGLG